MSELPPLPLVGIKVIDMSRHMAGPYGASMLADFGAEVIKVEPLHGDQSRSIGRDFIDGESGLFLTWNRGKRSIAVDVRSPAGREVFDRLVGAADVFLHNFRPVTARSAGLDYATLSTLNPGLVYAAVSGFGTEGTWADRPATDPVVQAMSGVMGVTGPRDGSPQLVGVPIADFSGAMLAVVGILLALRAREVSGTGQEVEISMLAGLMSALTTRLSSVLYGGYEPEPMGSAHSAVMPYQAFRANDGHIIAGAWGESGWPRFCAAIERPELVDDPRFATNQDRLRNRDELEGILDSCFAQRSRSEWEERFSAADGLFGYVYTVSEAIAQEQAVANRLLREVQHTTLGPIRTLANPVRVGRSDEHPYIAPPVLGEHSVDVLREHGFDDAEIGELVSTGVVIDGLAPENAS